MQRFILERAGQSLVSLLVVVSLVFVLARLTGNPLDLLLDDYASEDTKARVAADLGLDQPWPMQYAIYLSQLVAPVVGVYAAVNRGRWFDTVSRLIAMLGHSVPAFWLGIVLIWIFAVQLRL